jgi:hypothetical protein
VSESDHLARLASSARPTGSAAAENAQNYCRDVLVGLGFTVTPRPFEYSAFPGRFGTPVVGAWLAAVVTFAARAPTDRAASILVAGLVIGGVVGWYLGTRGVLSMPLMRRRAVNLEAVRGPGSPPVWLVAHVDSKGQPVPSGVRAAGTTVLALGIVAALLVSVFQWREAWPVVLVATWVGAVPVLLSLVDERGTGAVDNASGVAVVLQAAALLPSTANVGVLITDAEELGLAGARAWVRGRRPGIAVNCDGVDDEGMLTVMYTSARPPGPAKALRAAATQLGEPLRVTRMLPGILTDSVAFAGAHWETATLSRGSLRTLARVHTTRDTLAALRGTSIASTAAVLAQAATELA